MAKRLAFLAGALAGAAGVALGALVAYRSQLQLGSIGEIVTAVAALAGLGTLWMGWRDHVHRYAANVGISVEKPQGSATLTIKITNGNPAPVYRSVAKVFFLNVGELGHKPLTVEPGVGGVLHPGDWTYQERMDRRQIPDIAEVRFSDGNNRRWTMNSLGHLRRSST